MAAVSLFDNSGTPPVASAALTGTTEFSTGFVPAQTGYLVALHWFRPTTSSPEAPSHLRVWDVGTASILYEALVIPDSGAVGRQTHDLTSAVVITAGREYRASACFASGTVSIAQYTTVSAPPSPLSFAGIPRQFLAGACGFPNSGTNAGNWTAVDVSWDNAPPVGADNPPTQGTIANDFAAWLSTTDGTHTDSAPLQDHDTLATVDTNTAAVKTATDEWAFGLGAAAHGYFGALKDVIAAIKTVTDDLPTPIAQLTSIVLDHYTADIVMILGQIDSVLSGLGAQSTDLSGTAGSAVGALSGRTGFPATGWTMSAEADFTDAIAFAEAADAYVLSITSYQPTQPATSSPAGLWLPRLGWWCVLNGSLATQRQFVDFQQMILEDQGRRMPGCAIQLKPGTLATVQAWLLA